MLFLRCVLVFLALAGFAHAQSYPNKPVRLIISFTAGSSTDIVARLVMQKVSEYWGQPAVIENRAGAGGSIGSNVVATAAPDGYTLLVNSSAHAVNPAIYAKLPYDTLKDFIDVVPLTVQPNVLVVNATSPFKTLADLVNHAPAKRNPTLPEIPTTGEAGVRGADSPLWFGVWAPAGTPADVVQKVSADVRRALADPGVKEKLLALGNDSMDLSPAEFAKFVRDEIDTYQRVIKAAGIKPQ